MSAFVSAHQLLAYSQELCRVHDARIKAQVGSSADAKMFAKQLVADLSIRQSEPLGVSLMRRVARDPGIFEDDSAQRSLRGTASPPAERRGAVDVSTAALDSTATLGSRAAPLNDDVAYLRRAGPPSRLRDCPYCTDPHRRFCPESGRRHETPDERAVRLWRTMFRQIQFSSKMADLARLEKGNTCQEEFYIEF